MQHERTIPRPVQPRTVAGSGALCKPQDSLEYEEPAGSYVTHGHQRPTLTTTRSARRLTAQSMFSIAAACRFTFSENTL